MINKSFKRAAVNRKFAASVLTIITVFGLLILLFISSESGTFSDIMDSFVTIFSNSSKDTTSTNYP